MSGLEHMHDLEVSSPDLEKLILTTRYSGWIEYQNHLPPGGVILKNINPFIIFKIYANNTLS